MDGQQDPVESTTRRGFLKDSAHAGTRLCFAGLAIKASVLQSQLAGLATEGGLKAAVGIDAAPELQTSNARADASSSISAPIKFIQVDGLPVAYKVIGKGKPIVFLQRFRGTLNDWDPAFVDGVAKSRQVILFDAPGVGRSPGVVSTSVTKWADQAIRFTRALGIDRAAYLAWSMGG